MKAKGWELWQREFDNAYKFFNSEGSISTKAGLKVKWYKDFCKIMEEAIDVTKAELETKWLKDFCKILKEAINATEKRHKRQIIR